MIISEGPSLTLSDTYEVLDRYLTPVMEGNALYPALAIPFARKFAFDCPMDHLEQLKHVLPLVNRILIVGWRGNEQHFLNLLDLIHGKAPRILVVGWKSAGVMESVGHLESVGFAPDNILADERGFSNFLRDDSLENFLTAPIQG